MSFRQPQSPTDQRLAEAKREFAVELATWHNLPSPLARPGPDTELGRCLCPEYGEQVQLANALIKRCGRLFRCSDPGVTIPDLPAQQGAPSLDISNGRHPPRTCHFESACGCFRPPSNLPNPNEPLEDFTIDIFDFTGALSGYHVPFDAYGRTGDVVRMAVDALKAFARASGLTRSLVNDLKEMGALGKPASVRDITDATSKLNAALVDPTAHPTTRSRLAQRLNGRHVALQTARAAWAHFCARVNAHCLDRQQRDQQLLLTMQDDCRDALAMHLDSASAAALMRTCRVLSQQPCLKLRLPSPVPRVLVGEFPHMQGTSRDRPDVAAGVVRPVQRNFVLSRNAVRLYVDFCVKDLRPTALKKKDRTDGLDNKDHDFSDDEFEDGPEVLEKRGPVGSAMGHDPNSDWARRQLDHEKKERATWLKAEGPQEPVERYTYKRRFHYGQFLDGPLRISASLVFADDKTPVPDEVNASGLELSEQLLKTDGVFQQPQKLGRLAPVHVPGPGPYGCLPAFAKFHVKHLSFEYEGRLFCIKLDSRGTFKDELGGRPAHWVTYSEPFECVSKLEVVKKASDRKAPAGKRKRGGE